MSAYVDSNPQTHNTLLSNHFPSPLPPLSFFMDAAEVRTAPLLWKLGQDVLAFNDKQGYIVKPIVREQKR